MDTGHLFEGIFLHISLWLYTEMSILARYPGYTEETMSFLLSKLRFSPIFIAERHAQSVTILFTFSDISSSEIFFNHIELLKLFETMVFHVKFSDLSRGTEKKILKF